MSHNLATLFHQFEGVNNADLKAMILHGCTMDCPQFSQLDEAVWDTIIQPCWKKDPATRITFAYMEDHIANVISSRDYEEID